MVTHLAGLAAIALLLAVQMAFAWVAAGAGSALRPVQPGPRIATCTAAVARCETSAAESGGNARTSMLFPLPPREDVVA